MDRSSTTGDCVRGSVKNESDRAFMATVALHPYGQIWFYGQTSLSLLSLRYLEDEANDRGLIHETSEPF